MRRMRGICGEYKAYSPHNVRRIEPMFAATDGSVLRSTTAPLREEDACKEKRRLWWSRRGENDYD